MFVGTTTIFAREDIRTYTIPKERHTEAAPEAAPQSEASAPVKWTAPADWQERAPGNMVIGSLAVPGKDGRTADVSITMFGGDVGGELANINRWRTQVGLQPVSEPGKSEQVSVAGESGKLYELSNNGTMIYVASVPHNGSTWFFKLKGDNETVQNAKPAFREFLKSVEFTDSGEAVHAAADSHAGLNISPATGSDPHAGIANVPSAQAESDSTGPKMDVPATWKEKAPGPMVLKSYTVPGSNGSDATVSISTFPGDVGGKLGNVNRWRRQMGQPEVDDSQLGLVAKSFETGYSVDIEGTDAKSGKAARLIAIAIPHDGNTWFYKLLGDKNTVEESKATFLNFVKGVRY